MYARAIFTVSAEDVVTVLNDFDLPQLKRNGDQYIMDHTTAEAVQTKAKEVNRLFRSTFNLTPDELNLLALAEFITNHFYDWIEETPNSLERINEYQITFE